MTSKLVLITVSLTNSVALAASMEQTELTDRITKIVREYYPDAKIAQDNGVFRASHGTMIFTVHPRDKTGNVRERTYQTEGPNYQGFIIALSEEQGQYEGAAVVPQTLGEPYWRTFIDRPQTQEGKGHHVINFSYGSRLNEEFKKAIFEVLPSTKRQTKKP